MNSLNGPTHCRSAVAPVVALCLLTSLLSGCLTNPNQPPSLLRGDALSYPESARSQGIQGAVVVRYNVSSEGRVENAQVVSAEPVGVFEQAALKAVRGWRFRPGRQKGVASEFIGMVSTIEFKFGEADDYPSR